MSLQRSHRGAAVALTALALALPFIGRAAISSDGAEVVTVSLGFLLTGRFEAAFLPGTDLLPIPAFRSHYGLFPSILPLPFAAAVWPLRSALGARALDAAVALTWACGVLLAALAFLRLARRLAPGASPLLVPALIAGTFLWPYAADSFWDPWAAAAMAFAASEILRAGAGPARLFTAALAWGTGAWLRPILWVAAPVFLLAALVALRGAARPARPAFALLGGAGISLVIALLVNRAYAGSWLDFGYVLSPDLPFASPLLSGIYGLWLSPNRGLLVYAPVVIAALAAWPRLSPAARVLAYGTPAVLTLVIARWFIWSGGSCWGPRYLIAVLPLLLAPVALASRRLVAPLFALGVLVNVWGVLVAPGAFIGWSERLDAPPGSSWPKAGPDRVSTVPALAPIYGHAWLLFPSALPSPARLAGAASAPPPPPPVQFVSPLVLREALGLGSVPPITSRLLAASAVAYAYRGRLEKARLFARESLVLSPGDPSVTRFLSMLPPAPR